MVGVGWNKENRGETHTNIAQNSNVQSYKEFGRGEGTVGGGTQDDTIKIRIKKQNCKTIFIYFLTTTILMEWVTLLTHESCKLGFESGPLGKEKHL